MNIYFQYFSKPSRFSIFLDLDLYDNMTLQILCQLSKVQFSDHLSYSERKNNLKNSIGFFLKHKFCFCTFQLLLENMAEQKYWFRNVIQSSLYLKALISRSNKLNIQLKYCSWLSWLSGHPSFQTPSRSQEAPWRTDWCGCQWLSCNISLQLITKYQAPTHVRPDQN